MFYRSSGVFALSQARSMPPGLKFRPSITAIRLGSHISRPQLSIASRLGLSNLSYSTMAPITAWSRLIRYVSAKDGKIHYGEPIVSDKDDIDALAQKGALKVKILEGATAISATPTGEEDEVKTLLGPLTSSEVPLVRCIGLNYKTHSKSLLLFRLPDRVLNTLLCKLSTNIDADMAGQFSKLASISRRTQLFFTSPPRRWRTLAHRRRFQSWLNQPATTRAS